jgi:polysaccharide deacetylase 2 family uncharacterized protein YibQ
MSGLTVQDAGLVARDITNDVLDITMSNPMGTFDVTGIDKSVHERLAALQDAKITLTLAFNPATNRAHQVFTQGQTVPRQIVIPFPATGGSLATATLSGLITEISPARTNTGQLTEKATIDASGGVVTWS